MDPNQQKPTQYAGQPPQQPLAPPQGYGQTAYSQSGHVEYDPNYLDSIAPPPPQQKFLSGTYGKIFWVLIGLFVLAVSIIIAFSGGDDTADLQQVSVRLENYSQIIKKYHIYLKSNNLETINSNFQIWMTDSSQNAESLLKQGGIQKTDYNRDMVASEKQLADDLDKKLDDARLSARLNRVYASTMAIEAEKLINMFNTMAKKSKSKPIRDYAKETSADLSPIQKTFREYVDDGN